MRKVISTFFGAGAHVFERVYEGVALVRPGEQRVKFSNSMSRLAKFAMLAVLASGELSAGPVQGEAVDFKLENGLIEQCVRIADFPSAHYTKHDRKQEDLYCALDFSQLALCPKLWSTSPGTILYAIDVDVYEGDYASFEQQQCAKGHHARDAAQGKPATFKISVNGRDTSATYAPASWVYYHFSRYFHTNAHVPVAVYRSMDAAAHNTRVTKQALEIIGDRHSLRMLGAGWRFLDAVETGTDTGGGAAAALTDDGRQVFGVLIETKVIDMVPSSTAHGSQAGVPGRTTTSSRQPRFWPCAWTSQSPKLRVPPSRMHAKTPVWPRHCQQIRRLSRSYYGCRMYSK